MADRNPLDAILAQPDRPVAPPPDFARRLRGRVLAELAPDASSTREDPAMRHPMIAFPLASPAPARPSPARRRRWMPAVEIAAVLLLMLGAVGGYFGAGGFWAGQPGRNPVAPPSAAAGPAAMWGGDAARTGEQIGSGPRGDVTTRWRSEAGTDYVSGAAPIAIGDRVYRAALIDASSEGGGAATTTVLESLDAVAGRRLWRTELDVFGVPAATAGMVYVTVIVGGENASVAGVASALVALEAASGREVWRVATGDLIGAVATSPVVEGGMIYVADPDGTVYARDASTGQKRWTSTAARSDNPRRESREGNPAISASGTFAVGGGSAYVVNSNRDLYALDAASGSERWRINIRQRFAIVPEVVFPIPIGDEVVVRVRGFVPSSRPLVAIANLATLDAENGRNLWNQEFPGLLTNVAVADGLVLVPLAPGRASSLVAVDLKSGDVRWIADGLPSQPVGVSIAGDAAYVSTEYGAVHALDVGSGREF